jgi:diguanylate cyclase (GGDEF)-like protein/PAS domain S-box-containing protein
METTQLPDLQALTHTLQTLDGFFDWDLSASRIYFSPKWKLQAGYSEDEIHDEPDEWYRLIDPADRDTVRAHIASHLEGLTSQLNVEYRLMHRDGSSRWMLCRGLVFRGDSGNPHRLTGIQTDITEQKLAERHILKDAFRDALTGLPNRVLFLDRLDRVVQHHVRYPNEHFAIISIDIKPLLAGGVPVEWETLEPVLALASQNLQKGLRHCDTLARVGGSEFAVLLGRIQNPADAAKVLERLRLLAGRAYPFDDREVFVSIQAGIAVADNTTHDAQALFDNAQTAKQSKQTTHSTHANRKNVKDLDEKTLNLMAAKLKEAVQREDFRVQYLPWISLQTGQLAGFEALARWKRMTDEQIVGPEEFMAAAQKANLVPTIESQVMSVACRKITDWNKNFRKATPLFISVNICGEHFAAYSLPQSVQKAFTLSSLPPEQLILECPEHDIASHLERAPNIMSVLTQMGVRWAVDDFQGEDGFLAVVPRLPVSILKFTGQTISEAQQGDGLARHAQSLVSRAKALGFQLSAKGIENREQLDLAKSWGIHYAQGFYFSRPLDESEVWGLLTANPSW